MDLNNIIEEKIQKINVAIKGENTNILAKPFLKWVGGKTQILDILFAKFPKKINNYHEIFLGGGSVLFELLHKIKNKEITITKNIYAYDLNETLIHVYKNIQSSPIKVINAINIFTIVINSCKENNGNMKPKKIEEALSSKESYYYWIRNQYNNMSQEEKNSIEGSAMFIFLNKTCFRGLFRTGPNGFNVPYGNYKNPSIFDRDNLIEISMLIKDVHFIHSDFKQSLKNTKFNDFVYLDPPYAPMNDKSFVGYNMDGFNIDNHNMLFKLCANMKESKISFMMSNSNTQLIQQNFPKNKFNVETIVCKRHINSKDPGSKTEEVVIM